MIRCGSCNHVGTMLDFKVRLDSNPTLIDQYIRQGLTRAELLRLKPTLQYLEFHCPRCSSVFDTRPESGCVISLLRVEEIQI